MPLISLSNLLGRKGSKIGTPQLKLPDSVVSHDSIDKMEFENYADDSDRFRRMTIEEAPQVTADVPDPDPIDMSTATPEEFIEYQQQMKAAQEARETAPPYGSWDKLTRDVFYSYHTHNSPEIIEPVDPRVELHKRILPKLTTTDDHAAARNVTRDQPTPAAIATMAAVNVLRDLLGDELSEQAADSQRYDNEANQAADKVQQLDDLRSVAQTYHDAGKPVPDELRNQIKQAVQDKRAHQAAAAEIAETIKPIGQAAMDAIGQAAKAGNQAAEAAGHLPTFGSGFGAGEPTYESPEQALTIAEMWANNPQLRSIAELFGRLDHDIRFQRAKRVTGGNDEIVDVKFGDNLSRIVPSELALFGDDDFEDDFLARYAAGELLIFSTEGEENAGRGPIICVVDGSGSMSGERNVWARAVAMCLLHIARLEKRDFACIEFASSGEVEQWVFPGKASMDAELIVEMASHFFSGGTSPIQGVQGAVNLMDNAEPFKKADLVMIGDGIASFGPEDKRLRDHLVEKGVRIFGMAIGSGQRFQYLEEYCENVVHVSDFELADPSQATAELAAHVT